MFNCGCRNSIVKNLQASKFISSTITKIVAFQSIADTNSRIAPIDDEIQSMMRFRYKRINYISTLCPNPNYKWLAMTGYQIYKNNDITHSIIMLHLTNTNSKGFTILFSHGNSVCLGQVLSFLYDLSSTLKCNVISYDYSGYGHSTGTPSEDEVYSDIELVGDFARNVLMVTLDELILMGHSLGTAPTIHFATKAFNKVAGVVLMAPLASGMSLLLGGEELKKKNSKDVFNNKSKIGDIICPIFLIHGKRDQTIPIDHSYELAKSIHNIYKWYPKKGGHNNIVIDFRRKFYQKFRFYLDYLERMQNKHHQTSKMNLSGVLPSNGPIYKNLYGSTAMLQREENYLTSSLVNTDNKAKMMLSSSKENSESVQLDSQGNVDASKDKSFCTLKQDEYSNYLNYSEYTDRLSKDK